MKKSRVGQRPKRLQKYVRPSFQPKAKIELIENPKNPHMRAINVLFSKTKTVKARIPKIEKCKSFFSQRKRALEHLLKEITSNKSPEQIYKKVKDFDIGEYKAVGREKFCSNLANEINALKQAHIYADNILKKLESHLKPQVK